MCKFALQNGFVETILGRKCFIPLIKSDNKKYASFACRQAINAPIQGSNADLIKLAMCKLSEHQSIPFHILLQIHDELIIEAPSEAVADTINFVRSTMENVALLKVPLVVDATVSRHL
jgi:DNA polymerase-1